jgi:TRAP-type C4-dicarboxylate transport system permease small subunit
VSEAKAGGGAAVAAGAAPTRPLRRLVLTYQGIDAHVAKLEMAIAIVATFGMVLLVAAPMVLRKMPHEMRSGFISDYSWMPQLTRLLLTWAAFAGASLATRARGHIVVDVVTKLIPIRARAAFNVGAAGLAAGLCGVLAVVGAHVVRSNWEAHSVVPHVSAGQARLVVPVALALMAIRFFLVMLEDLDGAASGDLDYLRRIEAGQHPHATADEPSGGGGHGGGGSGGSPAQPAEASA